MESGAGQNSVETYGLGLMMNDGHDVDDDDDDEDDAPCLFALGLIRGLGSFCGLPFGTSSKGKPTWDFLLPGQTLGV